MHIFEINPDESEADSYVIDAMHQFGLPGLVCSACGQTWANVGIAYPSIDRVPSVRWLDIAFDEYASSPK